MAKKIFNIQLVIENSINVSCNHPRIKLRIKVQNIQKWNSISIVWNKSYIEVGTRWKENLVSFVDNIVNHSFININTKLCWPFGKGLRIEFINNYYVSIIMTSLILDVQIAYKVTKQGPL